MAATNPVIVHDNGVLRVASPGSYGSLTDPMSRLEQGRDDIIDLAHYADVLFDQPRRMPVVAEVASERLTMRPRTSNMRTRNRSGERRSCRAAFGVAVQVWADTTFWNATLLRLGMGCLVGAADPAVELRSERREAVDILAGEEEDGVGEDKPDGAVEPKSGQMEPLPPRPGRRPSDHHQANGEATAEPCPCAHAVRDLVGRRRHRLHHRCGRCPPPRSRSSCD